MAESNRRLVYSTDDGEIKPEKNKKAKPPKGRAAPKKEAPTLSPANRTVYVERDRKGRGGKTVTVVSNLQLPEPELGDLLKKVKTLCGAGGTIKEGTLEVQGDHRDRLIAYLQKEGHSVKQKGG